MKKAQQAEVKDAMLLEIDKKTSRRGECDGGRKQQDDENNSGNH